MSDQYIGEIRTFAFTFTPKGWARCDGTLMSISQNTALFSLLGTTYGGDGKSTFALPDLRGRVSIGYSDAHPEGASGGEESHTLSVAELPAHSHVAHGNTAAGNLSSPQANVWASHSDGYRSSGTAHLDP